MTALEVGDEIESFNFSNNRLRGRVIDILNLMVYIRWEDDKNISNYLKESVDYAIRYGYWLKKEDNL